DPRGPRRGHGAPRAGPRAPARDAGDHPHAHGGRALDAVRAAGRRDALTRGHRLDRDLELVDAVGDDRVDERRDLAHAVAVALLLLVALELVQRPVEEPEGHHLVLVGGAAQHVKGGPALRRPAVALAFRAELGPELVERAG